ncbi:MAG: hypothetical protein FWD88_06520 [Treponema sp.]|nr:hypothetical protein [Treponema sp.]
MPVSRLMTMEEQAEIALKAFALKDQGKPEECDQMLRQLPVPAYMAKFVKDHMEYFGEDFFEKYGFNLAEAEAEYGPDWLTR